MTDEEHTRYTRCPGCNRLLGHEPDCPTAAAEEQPGPALRSADSCPGCGVATGEQHRLNCPFVASPCPGCGISSHSQTSHLPDCPTLGDAAEPTPMYAISVAALGEIEENLSRLGRDLTPPERALLDDALALISAARENGPNPAPADSYGLDVEAEQRAMIESLSENDDLLTRQRAYLLAQVGSLILRLAGEKVAAGLLDLPAASVYADRERTIINAGLAQIAETNKGE